MIAFDSSIPALWNKRIVYAPNGFGKTTNSKKLKKHYEDLNGRPLIFTRKEIDSLVQSYQNVIYFGETAKNADENRRIKNDFETCGKVKDFFKENYGTGDIRKLKKQSFFIQKSKLKSLDAFDDIIRIDMDAATIFEKGESISFDKILDYQIYDEVISLLESKKLIKKSKEYKSYQIINDETMNCIEALKDFAQNSSKNNCPLCGKHFSSKEKLMQAIERKMKKYKLKNEDDLFATLSDITVKIHNAYYDSSISSFLYDFDENLLIEKNGMIKLIDNYAKLCAKVYSSVSKYIGSILINEDQKLNDLKNLFIRNNDKITLEKTNITNINAFTSFIINELKDIIANDNSISFTPIPNTLQVAVQYDDGQPVEKLYDVLSESEVKRFSLVVLRALIKYGKHDTLVLDDPIDSYDDYYMLIACNYIKTIVSETKLINWYILTNNFTALTNLSSIIKCESVIYYYVPDDIFTSNDFQISYFIESPNNIDKISKNELQLLRDYLKNSLDVDQKLAYISLIVTLRNFNTLVLKNYNRLLIKKGSRPANMSPLTYTVDSNYSMRIKQIIERYYMHYDENIDPSLSINSNTIEVCRIMDLYNDVCSVKPTPYNLFITDSTSLCDLREAVAKTSFTTFSGSKIIDLIFHKICIVSYLKYEFEKQLIKKLKNVFHYSTLDITSICQTNALKRKAEKAKEISLQKGYCAETYLNDYLKVFEKNKLLFNLFDHALEQMFPPYVATNVKDIKKFKVEIDRLESTY